jgi:predicted Zn-dependent protease with MMP-like domain
MTRERFQRLVEEALRTIPQRFRDEMHNVAVVVEDAPSQALLDEMGFEPGDTLYGLYQGTPLPERTWTEGNRLPDRITIYQQPIEEDSEDTEDAIVMIGETVIHEFGHYFGLSEEEIEEIEERYWRGDGDDENEEDEDAEEDVLGTIEEGDEVEDGEGEDGGGSGGNSGTGGGGAGRK